MICPECNKQTYSYMNSDIGNDICGEFCNCGFKEIKPLYKMKSKEIINNMNVIINMVCL